MPLEMQPAAQIVQRGRSVQTQTLGLYPALLAPTLLDQQLRAFRVKPVTLVRHSLQPGRNVQLATTLKETQLTVQRAPQEPMCQQLEQPLLLLVLYALLVLIVEAANHHVLPVQLGITVPTHILI
jgi:hypothetical protein